MYVDDLNPSFKRYGSGWFQRGTGYAGHHYWTRTRNVTKLRYAAWRPVLPEAGFYKVLVRIPADNGTSKRATYKVRTKSGWVTRVRSQYKWRGRWVSLGVHQLTTTPIVQLSDKTGERRSLRRRLAFDAVRFVPIARPATSSSEIDDND